VVVRVEWLVQRRTRPSPCTKRGLGVEPPLAPDRIPLPRADAPGASAPAACLAFPRERTRSIAPRSPA